MQAKTIIVGGGMAGMSCAMQLLEAGQDFLLVTDNLGGRIQYATYAYPLGLWTREIRLVEITLK